MSVKDNRPGLAFKQGRIVVMDYGRGLVFGQNVPTVSAAPIAHLDE
jgi:hypothetical protein